MPTTTSTVPSASPAIVCFASAASVNRDRPLTVTGNARIRSVKVCRCWVASSVVGTSTATCLPSCTALNAARTATSVLPNPTSPETTRSIGTARSMSALTSSIAESWSGVSVNGKASSSSRCQGVSGANACPGADWRAA